MRRIPIPVETRAPGGETNAYLSGSLLVDPASRTPELDAAVAARGVSHIAVTHPHPDHVGALAAYAEETEATVWALADHVDRFETATGIKADRTFTDGDRVGPSRVITTPGHAPDHVCFAFPVSENPSSQWLIGGDIAVSEGSVVVGAPEGNMQAYMDSLRRVRDAGYTTVYPGHGPVITDPKATIDRLIAHREEREQRILAVANGGASDVDSILKAAYEKDLTGVRDLARATVLAHLEKLVTDGRIDEDWHDRL